MAEKVPINAQVKKENLSPASSPIAIVKKENLSPSNSPKAIVKNENLTPTISPKAIVKKENISSTHSPIALVKIENLTQEADDVKGIINTDSQKIRLVKKENLSQGAENGDVVTNIADSLKTHVKKEKLSDEDSYNPDYKITKPDIDSKDNVLAHHLEKLNLGTQEQTEKPWPKEEKPKKKLLIFNLNGLLVHKVHVKDPRSRTPRYRRPDGVFPTQSVYNRPSVEEFLNFCFERFEVAIWSSAIERNVDGIMSRCFKGLKKQPLFIWDQDHCYDSGFGSLEKRTKPLFFKELKKVWMQYGSFSLDNTLLIDDKPSKALLNPPNTGIFPDTYNAKDHLENGLDLKGKLATWLNGLFLADDVPSYVAANPFGQPAIKEGHPDWPFYSNILRQIQS